LKQDVTINPDGSGKMVLEVVVSTTPPAGMGLPDATRPDKNEMLKSFGKSAIEDAPGVETWADISLGTTDDGRMKFKGTAYFKDVTKIQVAQGEEGGGVAWAKDPKGGMILRMAMGPDKDQGKGQDKDQPKPVEAKPPAMTDAELAEAVQQAKAQWLQTKPMIQAMLGKMKMEAVFHLPGTLGEVSGFKKGANGSVSLVIEGAKLLEAMEKQMTDDATLKAAIKAGKNPMGGENPPDEVMEKALGIKGPMTARVTGDLKPLFDYDKEVKAAKEAYPKMVERLGIGEAPDPMPR